MAAVVVLVISLLSVVLGQETCPPTPSYFREQFIAQCNNLTQGVDCDLVWGNFSSAFAGIPSEEVRPSNYDDYLNLFPITPDQDTSLFWSQTPNLVNMLSSMCSGADLTSSASITSNEIINQVIFSRGNDLLRWCGTNDTSSPDGIDYTNNCSCDVSFKFYQQFSVRFAQAASGTVFYLGYGERTNGTYSPESFFGRFELPNLNPSVVNKAVVLVVHRRDMGESCGEGSLQQLHNKFISKNIIPTCYNIYGDINVSSQLPNLTQCAVDIVTSIQQGRQPDANNCFSPGSSAASVRASLLVMLALALMMMFIQ